MNARGNLTKLEGEFQRGINNKHLLPSKYNRRETFSRIRRHQTYGRGASGRIGTPEDGVDAFGLGASGMIGTPDEGLTTLGRGASGRMGTPLANEMA